MDLRSLLKNTIGKLRAVVLAKDERRAAQSLVKYYEKHPRNPTLGSSQLLSSTNALPMVHVRITSIFHLSSQTV